MQIIDDKVLNALSENAKQSPRLRMNLNLHDSLEDKVQRPLNALEPGTILPIHRHLRTDETYLLIRGHLKVLIYNNLKVLIDEVELRNTEGKYGVSIPAGTWHTVEVLESGTVILEIKEGPYAPLSSEDIL